MHDIARVPIKVKKIPPHGSHLFVGGKILGVPMMFLIDTGASQSVVDKQFAVDHFGEIHIKTSDHHTTGLSSSIPNSEFSRLRRIHIGSYQIKPAEFALIDLSHVNAAYQMAGFSAVQGIIGGDILKKYDCVIDYRNKLLTFRH